MKGPAPVMTRRPAPRLFADPGPAPRVLPEPVADGKRLPPDGDSSGRPGISVLRDHLPASVLRQVFEADHALVSVSVRVPVGALVSSVALVDPAIEGVHRAEADDLIARRVHAGDAHLRLFHRHLPAVRRDDRGSAPHDDPRVGVVIDFNAVAYRRVKRYRHVGSVDLEDLVRIETSNNDRRVAVAEIKLFGVIGESERGQITLPPDADEIAAGKLQLRAPVRGIDSVSQSEGHVVIAGSQPSGSPPRP